MTKPKPAKVPPHSYCIWAAFNGEKPERHDFTTLKLARASARYLQSLKIYTDIGIYRVEQRRCK